MSSCVAGDNPFAHRLVFYIIRSYATKKHSLKTSSAGLHFIRLQATASWVEQCLGDGEVTVAVSDNMTAGATAKRRMHESTSMLAAH